MSKISLTNLSDLNNSNTVVTNINNNNSTIQTAMDNTLSRDGTSPNQMNSNLDMNNNHIINLPSPVNLTEAVRLLDLQATSGNGAALAIAVGQAQSSATTAATSATAAAGSAATATTQATNAATSATNAAASATTAANTLATLLVQGIWNNTHTTIISGAYNVVASDKTKTIQAGGSNCYTIAFGSPAGFASDFVCFVQNTDATRAKSISLSGYTNPILLWPLYGGFVFSLNGVWYHTFKEKWKPSYGAGGLSNGITFYVNPTGFGNDALTNDGLVVGSPLNTIQEGVNRIHNLIEHGTVVPTVQLADGTHQVGAGVFVLYPFGHTELLIRGNPGTPTNCVIFCNPASSCFSCQEPTTVTIDGVYLNTTGAGSTGISARQFTTCDLGNISYGNFPAGVHVSAINHASMGVIGNQHIYGSAAAHYSVGEQSFISDTAFGGFIEAGLNIPNFITVTDCSVYQGGGPWVGPGSGGNTVGTQYVVATNGVIHNGGTVFPGNQAGTVVQQGLYVA